MRIRNHTRGRLLRLTSLLRDRRNKHFKLRKVVTRHTLTSVIGRTEEKPKDLE